MRRLSRFIVYMWRVGLSKTLGKFGIGKCPECGSFNCVDVSPNCEWRSFFRCLRKGCNHHFVTRRPRFQKVNATPKVNPCEP